MKKYIIYALIGTLAIGLAGCGQTKKADVQKLQDIKDVKGNMVTVGDKKVSLDDTIIALGDISNVKKGNKAYVASAGDKKYLVVYTGHKETKEKEGTEIIDVVKEVNNDGITLSNGKFYSVTTNTTEQTIDDIKNVKKYNPTDFKAGDVVRMLVKENKIIAVVRY